MPFVAAPSSYVDGSKLAKKHGALSYVECGADDVKPGKVTSFPQAVKRQQGEVVVVSWIVYRSHRDRADHRSVGFGFFTGLLTP